MATSAAMKVVKDEPVESQPKKSLFGAAKEKKTTASPKTDKPIVEVKGLEPKLLEYEELKAQLADIEAQLAGVTDELKNIAKEKFIELYKSNKANPNTFLVKDGNGCVMVIPSDKYISIKDGERADQLNKLYGDIVNTEERYYFNNEVLERNRDEIERLIMEATTISEADKENLLLKEVKYSVAKGTIDRLASYGDKMEAVINEVQPIIMLKNCGGKMAEGGSVDGVGKEFIITDVPVFRGFSKCCFAPVFGDSNVCPKCGEVCMIMSDEELDKKLAEDEEEAKTYGAGGELLIAGDYMFDFFNSKGELMASKKIRARHLKDAKTAAQNFAGAMNRRWTYEYKGEEGHIGSKNYDQYQELLLNKYKISEKDLIDAINDEEDANLDSFISWRTLDAYKKYELSLMLKYGITTHSELIDKITDEEDTKLDELSTQFAGGGDVGHKWFKPNEDLGGWNKELPAAKRRKAAVKSRTEKKRHDKYLSAAHALQALANVTTDEATKEKAKADADYFFEKVKEKKEKGGSLGKLKWKKHKELVAFEKEIKSKDDSNRIEDVVVNANGDWLVYYVDNSGTTTKHETKLIHKEKKEKGGTVKGKRGRKARERDPDIKKRCPSGMRIQSLLFDKEKFTAEQARAWCTKHGFSKKGDDGVKFFRARQEEPKLFKKDSFRTIDIDEGVKATVGCKK